MRKLFVALLLVIGAALLVMPALADPSGLHPAKLMNARWPELKSRAARLGGPGAAIF
jgi:hypothetical protein